MMIASLNPYSVLLYLMCSLKRQQLSNFAGIVKNWRAEGSRAADLEPDLGLVEFWLQRFSAV